ncbi:MAG: MFS transporter [Gammaproteobacteria bacterium]|nr:MFS transporter [Gammaproteobacteria bacterium]
MSRTKLRFLFLNVGHFLDHLFVLIFATAALKLTTDWGLGYAELIPYATPGFVAFGLCAIPAGWLADKWSREGMMVVFFIGIGLCSIMAGFANSPLQMGICLTLVGMFAAIYHPVGLAMVVQGLEKTGVPLAINGIFGNMGVASAVLLTGLIVDHAGWRSAFFLPGVLSVVIGLMYLVFIRSGADGLAAVTSKKAAALQLSRRTLVRVFGVVLFTTALGGLVFQSTTFALPKIFDERLTDIAGTATWVGIYAFIVFSIAALAQLVVGYLVDSHSVRTVFAVVALSQAVFFFVMTQLEGIAALLVAIAFMLVVFGQIPINDVLVGRMARSEWRSRAYAVRYIVTFTVSATAVPLIAWIHGSWGFAMLFSVLAVTAFAIFLATLVLPGSEDAQAPVAA